MTTGPEHPPSPFQPAGLPLQDAASWVGQACWCELHVHGVLGTWMADDAGDRDPAEVLAWWSIRSTRADLAEAWHRRLPELREFPRSSFVRPPAAGPSVLGDALDGLASVSAEQRSDALAAVLVAMGASYRAHGQVARGPADGPVAAALERALAAIDRDLGLLRYP